MTTKHEALLLAEYYEALAALPPASEEGGHILRTAAELRRLHEENAELWKEREEPHRTIGVLVRECNRLEIERDELLVALKQISAIENLDWGSDWEEIEQAREIANAAIKKVEGGEE